MEIKAIYSITEVASMVGVERWVVRQWIDAGHLDAIQIGKLWFVPLSSLQSKPELWQSIELRGAYDTSGEFALLGETSKDPSREQ